MANNNFRSPASINAQHMHASKLLHSGHDSRYEDLTTPSPAFNSPWSTRPPSPTSHDGASPSRMRSVSQKFVRLSYEEPEADPTFCVISGGSGANFLVDGILKCCSDCHFVMPISDNGGSSSEIIRCLGGPSIGDIRSRLIRLIPPGQSPDSPTDAIKRLLSFRLSATDNPADVKATWLQIVEGEHPLWQGIPADRREAIRAFFVHIESELLKRAHRRFNFRSGSIGNFLIAGALSFFRSIESAIFLFSTITGIPERTKVIPCINTNSVATIVAELANGSVIVGQNAISHPIGPAIPNNLVFEGNVGLLLGDDDKWGAQLNTPEENPDATRVEKDESAIPALEAPISQIYYINSFGKQVWPRPNPRFIDALHASHVLIYSCGSLWTSIMPCLAIRGVGRAIAQSTSLQKKVLLLNATPDRETAGMTAIDYVIAIQRTLNKNIETKEVRFSAADYVTHIVYLENSQVEVDEEALKILGISTLKIACEKPLFDDMNIKRALQTLMRS